MRLTLRIGPEPHDADDARRFAERITGEAVDISIGEETFVNDAVVTSASLSVTGHVELEVTSVADGDVLPDFVHPEGP